MGKEDKHMRSDIPLLVAAKEVQMKEATINRLLRRIETGD